MLTLHAGGATLLLAPEIGGGVVQWRHRGRPMFRPTAPATLAQAAADGNSRQLACYPLVPFSGRVANRRFSWQGVSYDLPERFGGFAIHGVGWLRPWTVTAQTATSARLELEVAPSVDWPFAFRSWQNFTLAADSLAMEIGIENRHDAAAPCGFGLHPFFPRSPELTLQFTAGSVWHNAGPGEVPSERTAIPPEWDHHEGRKVGPVFIDNDFPGWDGRALLRYPDRGYQIRVTADKVFGHTVVYVPDGRDFFAIEPVSHMNDALNRIDQEADNGILVLSPGESRSGCALYAVEECSLE
jgi:aldose 1-epimerase